MVVGYKVMYQFFIDENLGQFKAPINEINNEARVFTPKDTGISTPNSDTPYSMAMLDLRAEPFKLCMPEIEKGRYYDVQLADMDNIKKIQAGYTVQPLSAFLGQPAPPAAPAIDWPTPGQEAFSTAFPEFLAFLLQFCPAEGSAVWPGTGSLCKWR